jgi:hypothetical protein
MRRRSSASAPSIASPTKRASSIFLMAMLTDPLKLSLDFARVAG